MGCSLPPGSARARIPSGSHVGRECSYRLDDWLSVAGLHFRSAGSPQAGELRWRHHAASRGDLGLIRQPGNSSRSYRRNPDLNRFGRGDAAVHRFKEANPPELGGTATGVINFINFTFSALPGPVFGARLVEMPEGDTSLALAHYQAGFKPLLYGIIVALILTVFLRETGPAIRET